MNQLAHSDFVEAKARLTGAGMDARMAEAVVETVNGVAAAVAARPEDLERTERRLSESVAEVKGELKQTEARLDRRITEVKGELKSDIAGVRTEIAELRGEMNAGFEKMRGETDAGFEKMRTEIAKAGNTSFRQIAGIVGFGAALFVVLNMLTPALQQMLGLAP